MAKRGRKKKPGARYAKNKRLTRAATQEDVMGTALGARMRHFEVTKTAALEREPGGPQLMGFPLGRLLKRGYVSKAQYAAGNRFAEVMRSYLATKGIGSATAPAQDLNRRGASLSERPVQHEGEALQMMAALREADCSIAGRSSASIIWDVCLREYSEHLTELEMGRLREGLNAIGRVIQRRERMSKKAA